MAAVALAVLGGCEEKPLDTPTEAVLNIPFSSKTLEASKGTFVLNVESNVDGVFYAGAVTAPKNVGESINEGTAAARAVVEWLEKR